jgi:hypothetical protein
MAPPTVETVLGSGPEARETSHRTATRSALFDGKGACWKVVAANVTSHSHEGNPFGADAGQPSLTLRTTFL